MGPNQNIALPARTGDEKDRCSLFRAVTGLRIVFLFYRLTVLLFPSGTYCYLTYLFETPDPESRQGLCRAACILDLASVACQVNSESVTWEGIQGGPGKRDGEKATHLPPPNMIG